MKVDRLKSRMEETRKRISQLKDKTTEITQSEQQGVNRLKTHTHTNSYKHRVLGTCETITKDLTFVSLEL